MFGSDLPLWSLAYEGWYYVIFGFAFFVWAKGRDNLIGSVICVALLLAGCVFVGARILEYGLVWLLGAAAYLLGRRPLPPPLRGRFTVAVLFVAIGAVAHGVVHGAQHLPQRLHDPRHHALRLGGRRVGERDGLLVQPVERPVLQRLVLVVRQIGAQRLVVQQLLGAALL